MIDPGTKWNDYSNGSLYLWNGDVLYVATQDSNNVTEEDEARGYMDSWVVDIYSTTEEVPQGGQWMETKMIEDLDYTIQGVMDRLGGCDLWKDDWRILEPDIGEVLQMAFEKLQSC